MNLSRSRSGCGIGMHRRVRALGQGNVVDVGDEDAGPRSHKAIRHHQADPACPRGYGDSQALEPNRQLTLRKLASFIRCSPLRFYATMTLLRQCPRATLPAVQCLPRLVLRASSHMPVSVVTGATGGIGRWIALGLARAGHTVVLVGRDRTRGEGYTRLDQSTFSGRSARPHGGRPLFGSRNASGRHDDRRPLPADRRAREQCRHLQHAPGPSPTRASSASLPRTTSRPLF